MALNLITNIGTELTLSSQWGDLSTLLDQVKTGIGNKIRVHSLTNWDSSTTKPAIAEGSLFDVGGSLYLADADTALTDEAGLIDGTCHIKLVPAVDGLTVTPTLTNDSIPAWDETKHGWYDGADSFLPYEFTKASAVYSDKFEYEDQNRTIEMYSDGAVGNAPLKNSGVLHTLSTTNGAVYSFLSPAIPEIGDKVEISGCRSLAQLGSGSLDYSVYSYVFSYAERQTTTEIRLYYSISTITFDNTGSLIAASDNASLTQLFSGSSSSFNGSVSIAIGNRIP